jgi:hypothetical protein
MGFMQKECKGLLGDFTDCGLFGHSFGFGAIVTFGGAIFSLIGVLREVLRLAITISRLSTKNSEGYYYKRYPSTTKSARKYQQPFGILSCPLFS